MDSRGGLSSGGRNRPSPRGRIPLSPEEIVQLDVALSRAFRTARYGGAICDVLIENGPGEERRVEVKATGEHAFQEFKAKDLRADFLVWIRFGRRFNLGQGPIEIAILSDPSRFIANACRLDTARFEKRIGASDSLRILSFDSLEALLR
jgi:hypothetical protein